MMLHIRAAQFVDPASISIIIYTMLMHLEAGIQVLLLDFHHRTRATF